jgi:hypothetical protein
MNCSHNIYDGGEIMKLEKYRGLFCPKTFLPDYSRRHKGFLIEHICLME